MDFEILPILASINPVHFICYMMRSFFLIVLSLYLSSFSKPLVEVDENSCVKIENTFSINEALNQVQSETIKDSTYLACLYHQIGNAFYNNYDNIIALQYYKEAIRIREQNNDGLLWLTHHNIALTYHDLSDYNKAIFHNQLSYNIAGFKQSIDSISILRFLSEDYAAIGDTEQALKYGKMVIKIDADTLRLVKALNSLALSLVNANDSSKAKLALHYLDKALELKNEEDISDNIWSFVNINKGFAYGVLNQNNEALQQYNLALNNLPKEDTLRKTYAYNNIGVELLDQKKYKLALEKFEHSLKLKQAYYYEAEFEFEYAFNYENIGDCYFKMNNYEIALNNYQTTIINLTNSFRSTDVFKNPISRDGLYVYSNLGLVRVLDAKAKTAFALYKQNGKESYLQLAHQTYKILLDFHNQLQQEITTENSRLFQAKNLSPYIENALNVAYEKQENGTPIAESAFRLMEKNKATVLLQSINESQALQYANLPDTIIEQEDELKTAISFYKKQFNDAKVYEEPENINRFEKLLFEEENKYKKLISNLESNYPNYYQLKYQQNEIQLKDAQDYLNKDAAMIEYFIGDSSIYVLSIEKQKSKLYKASKPKNWNELINNFRQSVTDIDLIQNEGSIAFEKFTKSAFELYTILLEQPLTDLELNITHLKIIPDAELNYLPFDILLTKPSNSKKINYANLSYLLNEQTISYAYSMALLMESNQLPQTENDILNLYAGFAPVYETANTNLTKTSLTNSNQVLQSEKLVDLPNARKSVQQIADLLTGKAFLTKEATKRQFLDKAHQFKIIHLATHGFLDDENPLYSNLVFANTVDSADYSLYAADLYNLELNADLVVLSACNTGTGKLQKGEGVMSLSRAFTYAGSNSLVMSLWEVPDKSTATIMQNFFQQLKNGKTKDDALQAAKIDFIQQYPARAHPLFWAGFVPSGNMHAIDFENGSSNWWIWTLIIITFLIGSGIAFNRK